MSLPWCEAMDAPYWHVNMALCLAHPEWRDFQRGKPMAEIIPAIDERVRDMGKKKGGRKC